MEMKDRMKQQTLIPVITIFLVFTLNLASALIVDADYITIYPGEQGSVKIEVENNFDYDIEEVSVALDLEDLSFTSIGSSEKTLDDLDEGDDDSATFTLKSSTDITPGDYNIPYTVKYTNADEENATQEEKEGSFGIRVSAKTDIDFSVEAQDAIVGQQGKISLKIINKGLGEIKFVSVQIFPEGFELVSSEKIYIGNIDSDDSDFATFDVIFKTSNPTLTAKVDYKDFDNEEQSETVRLSVKVYTFEEALKLGLIKQSKTGTYVGVVAGVLIIWFIWRKIKKRRKKNKLQGGR